MRSHRWKLHRAFYQCLFIATAFVVLGGCHSVPITPASDLEISEPIPVTVGIYYPPGFKSHTFIEWTYGIEPFFYPLGEASTDVLDLAFRKLFKTVVVLRALRDTKPTTVALAGIIEPSIEEFKIEFSKDWSYRYSAEITFRFTLYSPSGERLTNWSIRGSGAGYGDFFHFSRPRGEAAAGAIARAAESFAFHFEDSLEVRQWLGTIRKQE